MNYESDDYCIADYGAFGWNNCNCASCRSPIPKRSPSQERLEANYRRQRDRERTASSNFNRYMIDLYNGSAKV